MYLSVAKNVYFKFSDCFENRNENKAKEDKTSRIVTEYLDDNGIFFFFNSLFCFKSLKIGW